MKASNCVNNLRGTDRDEAVKKLPSAEDLDKIADEKKIADMTAKEQK